MTYQHILLATDLSALSEQVAVKARQLAQQHKAKLGVIHVVEQSPMAFGGEFSIPIDANLDQVIMTQAREALTRLASQLKIDPEQQFLERGSVKQVIADIATQQEIDLIIIGTHGHSGIDRLLGSHANAILHYAPCDVLVVRTST